MEMERLRLASSTLDDGRLDMSRWALGGIILSSAVIKCQLGVVFHGGSLIAPLSAATPHGTCESAMNAAFSALTSPANEAGNFALSSRKYPSCGGVIGGTGAPGTGALIRGVTCSPLSGAKAGKDHNPATC